MWRQVGVFKRAHPFSLCAVLKQALRRIATSVTYGVFRDLMHHSLEQELANQQLRGLLLLLDLLRATVSFEAASKRGKRAHKCRRAQKVS